MRSLRVRHRDRSRGESGGRAICYLRPIQLARRIRGPAGPIATLVTAALAAAGASAAASSSVSISGPRTVDTGGKVKLHFTGYAATGVHGLRVWLDNRKCADTANAEGARPELKAPTKFRVGGNFKAVLTVDRSTAGTHVVCAYLTSQSTQNTAARASWRYVTR